MNQQQMHASERGRGLPLAFATGLALCLAIGVGLGAAAERFADSQILVYLEKRAGAERGPAVDVFVVGASQTVAAIRPEVLARALPPGTRVYNYGAPALAPSGGESLLRRYLDTHEPPRLLVFSHEVMMYSDRRGEFERFTLTHMLRADEMWRATLADRRPYYALSWLSTRLPTVRYREGLRGALGAWLLDRIPALEPQLFAWLGEPDTPAARFRFEWNWTGRAARNAALREQLARDMGWHFWRENAMDLARAGAAPARGAPGWAARGVPDPVQPFEASPRETQALERVLALCRERGIRVLVPSMPHAEWYALALRAGPGAERMQEFWSGLQQRPGVRVGADPILIFPNELYADPTHLNPRGADRYSE